MSRALSRTCYHVALPPKVCHYNASRQHLRAFSNRSSIASSDNRSVDIEQLLATPSWSVASLLPWKESATEIPEVTSKQLHHLLRLSALPPPKDEQEEQRMLSTLSSQLHFVKDIQKVDTTGIEPLRSLRDETAEGEKEAELGMEDLNVALAKEEVRGRYHKRIRRRRDPAW